MNYGELVAEVLLIVPREDKEALIRSKINQVIRFLAGSGDYWRALTEVTIGADDGVEASEKVQQIVLDSNFRKLVYVEYPDGVSDDIPMIKVRDPQDLLLLKKCGKDDDTAYLSGGMLRIKHTITTSSFNIGYYAFPDNFNTDGSDDTKSNWITEAVPGLITDLASAYILNLIGDNEDSARITQLTNLMQLPFIRAQIYASIKV